MKHVYFVRHGQSNSNVDGVRRDGDSTILTDLGESQANIVAKRFANIPIDIVLTSPYKRAYDTGKTIADSVMVDLEIVDIAHERILPDEILGKNRNDPDMIRVVDEVFEGWLTGDIKHPTAEDFIEIVARVDKLQEIIANREEDNIVITSHGFFGKIFTQRVLLGDNLTAKTSLHMTNRMLPSNTGITKFQIGDDGKWVLINWNDDAHLGELPAAHS